MYNKNNMKIATIILSAILAVVTIALVCVSIALGIYVNKDFISIDESSPLYKETTKNFLINDALEKVNDKNEENVSLFFLQRKGAFISTQILIDALLQLQLNPGKEIYVAFDSQTYPGVGDYWSTDMHWDLIIPSDHILDFSDREGLFETDREITNEKIDYFVNDVLGGAEDGSIDLYIESWTWFQNQEHTLIDDLGDSLHYFNSINYFTDGTAHFNTEKETEDNLSPFNEEQLVEFNSIVEQLVNGEINTSDISSSTKKKISSVFPVLNPANIDINVAGLTSEIYTAHDNVMFSSGLGLEAAGDLLNEESKTLMKQIVNLNQYDIDKGTSQVGKTNLVLSGNHVEEGNSSAEHDANMIIEIYNELLAEGSLTMDQVNILYKPHPRSVDSALDKMVEHVSTATGTDASTWVQIIPKEIPFEFFVLTGEFDDDPLTNTDYQMYLTGTSTVVPAAYDSGIKSDNVVEYHTSADGLKTMHEWYDGTDIIDWNKVVVTA